MSFKGGSSHKSKKLKKLIEKGSWIESLQESLARFLEGFEAKCLVLGQPKGYKIGEQPSRILSRPGIRGWIPRGISVKILRLQLAPLDFNSIISLLFRDICKVNYS